MSFERHTRRKVKNYHSEVDTDALWNSIQNEIPNEKEKKKRGIFFLFFGFAIMGGVTALYFNNDVRNQLANYSLLPQSEARLATLLPEDIYYENQMYISSDALANETFLENHFSTFTSTILQNTNPSQRIEKEVFHSSLISYNTLTSRIGNVTIAKINTERPIKTETEIKTEKILVDDQKLIYLNTIPFMDGLVEKRADEEELLATLDDVIQEETTEETETENEAKKVGVAIGLNSSYSKSNAQYKTKSRLANSFLKTRNYTEKGVATFSLSGDVVLSFKKNIQLRTGLSYTQISERFTISQSSNTSRSKNVVVPASGYPDSDEDIIADLNNHITASSTNNTSQHTNSSESNEFISLNKHHILDIPLVLGYEFNIKKFTFLVETGAYINLNTTSNGYIATADSSFAKISEQENSFKRNILLTSYSAISAKFNMSPNTFFKIGAQYQYTPFSMTTNDNILNQKYHMAGAHFGIYRILK